MHLCDGVLVANRNNFAFHLAPFAFCVLFDAMVKVKRALVGSLHTPRVSVVVDDDHWAGGRGVIGHDGTLEKLALRKMSFVFRENLMDQTGRPGNAREFEIRDVQNRSEFHIFCGTEL
jgi:hypothetical protein